VEVGGVDQQPIRLASLRRQRREDAVEHAEPAPADEAVVNRVMPVLSFGASRQRSPLRITKIMSLMIRRSSTPGIPCDSGKWGSIRRICASDNKIRSLMATPPDVATEST